MRMAITENLSSNDETDGNYPRERVITPDRLHYSDTESESEDGEIPQQSEMIFRQFMSQRA